MIRLLLRTLTEWGFGRIVSLVSPLQKFSSGLGIALWLGILFVVIGVTMLWFYPDAWFGENLFDFFGGMIAFFSALIAYAAFAVKKFGDKKVEEISDLGQEKLTKAVTLAKDRFGENDVE